MARVSYNKIASPDSFIGQYMSHMSELETALAYDFWSAVWAIGNACGRNVYVDRPRAPVYLNWYIILVAESGVTRKSTAVREIRQIITPILEENNALLIENKSTPEGILDHMARLSHTHKSAHVAISVAELVTFLGKERYALHMPGLLTDLYDCPDERTARATIATTSYPMQNVFVSFMSASTPSWLERAINPDVVEGGFTSRTIIILSEKPKARIAWPTVLLGRESAQQNLTDKLRYVAGEARRVGALPITDNAKKRFSSWYKSKETSRDPYRNSFESREDDHVLCMAACLAINDELFIIDKVHVDKAIKIINEVKQDGASLFAGGITPSKLLLGIDKARTMLTEAGMNGIAHARMYQTIRTYMSSAEFKTLMSLMHEHDMVQKFEERISEKARPRVIWRGTTALNNRARLDDVLTNLAPNAK